MKEKASEIFRIYITKLERIIAFSDVTLCIGRFNITDVSKESNPFVLKRCCFYCCITAALHKPAITPYM